MDASEHQATGDELVLAGVIRGASSCDVDLTVAIETVAADDDVPEILGLFGTRIRTDANGRFADRYAVPDELRRRLHGWVMCTVVVQPRLPGAGAYTKVVRWQRSSSQELLAGLSALLAPLSFTVEPCREDSHMIERVQPPASRGDRR